MKFLKKIRFFRILFILLLAFLGYKCITNFSKIKEGASIVLDGIIGSDSNWKRFSSLSSNSPYYLNGKNAGYVSITKKTSTGSLGNFRCSGTYLGKNPLSGKDIMITNNHCVRASNASNTVSGPDGVGYENVLFDISWEDVPSADRFQFNKVLASSQALDFALLESTDSRDIKQVTGLNGVRIATPQEILDMESDSNNLDDYYMFSVNCNYYATSTSGWSDAEKASCARGIFKLFAEPIGSQPYQWFSNGNKRHYASSAGGSSGSGFISKNITDFEGKHKMIGIHWGASQSNTPLSGNSSGNWAKCAKEFRPLINQFLPDDSGSTNPTTTTTTSTTTTTTTQPVIPPSNVNLVDKRDTITWFPYKKYCLVTSKKREYCHIEKWARKTSNNGYTGVESEKLNYFNEPKTQKRPEFRSDDEIMQELEYRVRNDLR